MTVTWNFADGVEPNRDVITLFRTRTLESVVIAGADRHVVHEMRNQKGSGINETGWVCLSGSKLWYSNGCVHYAAKP